jgi:mono/diheme cytochrome c family protein
MQNAEFRMQNRRVFFSVLHSAFCIVHSELQVAAALFWQPARGSMPTMSRMLMVALLCVGTATAVDAQRRGGDPQAAKVKNPVAATEASIKIGRQLYGQNCRACHGLRAGGDGPMATKNPAPANLTDAQWDFGGSDGEIFAVIMNGPAPKSVMKGMKGALSDEDVWHVINYIRSLGPKS